MGVAMAKLAVVLVVVVAVLSAVGCSANSVYDSDRDIQDQMNKAAVIGLADVEKVAPAVDATNKDAVAALQETKQVLSDVKAGTDQELKNWGPPKQPKNYTPQNIAGVIKTSDAAHTTPWYKHWISLALYGAGAALTLAKIAVQFYPPLAVFMSGPIGKLATSLVQMAVNLGHKADSAPDDKLHLNDIKSEVGGVLAANPNAAAFVNRLATKLGIAPAVSSLLGPPQPPTPTAAPVPAAPGAGGPTT
jgi:hypothetical protein